MNRNKFLSILWWGIGIGIVIGCSVSDYSGFDYYVTFLPQGLKMSISEIRNPMWIYLIISPITHLPVRLGFAVFSAINLIQLHYTCKLYGANRFAVLLSFPALWIFWYGQLDIYVAFGIVLGAWSLNNNRPILTGVSILLIMIKPQLGLPISIAYFIWSLRQGGALKTIYPILGITFLTLLVWGWDWPIHWVINLTKATGADQWFLGQKANIGLYPYGLIAWLGLLIPMSREKRIQFILVATIVSMPYIGTYSLIILLVLQPHFWFFVLASTPVLFGQFGYSITALISPLFLLSLLPQFHTGIYTRAID
jgi:hypothetical protein